MLLVGTALRHVHGSQCVLHAFQDELRFLGIQSSPSFVRSPNGNGCVERFIRTLKELLLWFKRFATVDDFDRALKDFAHRYNNHWIIGRRGYKTPAQHRRSFLVEGGVSYANTCVNNGILYPACESSECG